jgi:predicted DNA-binding transcriptional regulator YafY
MPLNKEALIRYRVINRCLVDYKYVSKNRLMAACHDALDHEIGERTLEQDIHEMKFDRHLGYEAPIEFSKEKSGYYYTDPDFTIDNIPINAEELEALTFAATMLDQYKHIGIFSTFSGAVQKIVDAVNIRRILKESPSYPFVEFEKAPMAKGSEFLPVILHAIKDRKVLSFLYQRFDADKPHRHILHPYHLKEYRNRWYLIGYHHELKEIRTYCFDRILEVQEDHSVDFQDTGFDPAEYFQSTVGIIVPHDKPQHIVLRFSAKQGKYILTLPIHESQEILEVNDAFITVSLDVAPNYELFALILGWGAEVEVLKPTEMRDQIKGILSGTLERYLELID